MTEIRVEREIGGRTLSLSTGKVAKQAHAAVWVQYGDTVVLCTVLSAPSQRDLDFFPLFVDYRENQYAAGKIPGGFFKREGRPSTKEILTMRMIDRPIRPLFPYDFRNEVQIQCPVLSTDNQNDPDVLAMIGAAAALSISPAPFEGPVGTARVGYVNGEFVIMPTHDQMDESDMDLLVAGPREAPNMIEMSGQEVSEEIVAEGIAKAFDVCNQIMDMVDELASKVEVTKSFESKGVPQELKDGIYEKFGSPMREAKQIPGKTERGDAMMAIREEVLAEYLPADLPEGQEPPYTEGQIKEAYYKTEGFVRPGDAFTGTAAEEPLPPLLTAQQIEDVVAFLMTLSDG